MKRMLGLLHKIADWDMLIQLLIVGILVLAGVVLYLLR